MKKYLMLFLLPYIMIFSQDDKSKNPNVELPDFVITGADVVSIKRADKIKPDFVSTITSDFILPLHSPEELGLKQLSNPIKEDLKLLDSTHFAKGSIKANAGIYTLPGGELSYAYPFKDGILIIDLILSILISCLSIYAGLKLWKIRPDATKTTNLYLNVFLIYSVIIFFVITIIFSISKIPFNTEIKFVYGQMIRETISSITFVVILKLYLKNSERVKNTFGTNFSPTIQK